MEDILARLKNLGLEPNLPIIDEADIPSRPLDIYRSHLAGLVADAVQCDVSLAYRAIVLPNDLGLGDFAVVIPRLQLKDKDVESIVLEVSNKVWDITNVSCL
jgi:arginyl-tRNA synthetase